MLTALLPLAQIYWIALVTMLITFVPKLNAVYRNATGLLPDRFTDSKNGANNSGQGSNTSKNVILRSLKDFAGATIRMLDRVGACSRGCLLCLAR